MGQVKKFYIRKRQMNWIYKLELKKAFPRKQGKRLFTTDLLLLLIEVALVYNITYVSGVQYYTY